MHNQTTAPSIGNVRQNIRTQEGDSDVGNEGHIPSEEGSGDDNNDNVDDDDDGDNNEDENNKGDNDDGNDNCKTICVSVQLRGE